MKNKFLISFAILPLSLALSLAARAQTTEEGSGPSEQPSAPMEIGQGRPVPPSAQTQLGRPDANGGYGGQQDGEEAQPGGPSGEGPAKTDQGVGRVSMIHGDVSTQRGDSGDWSAAVLNQPVVNGDKVSTGTGGRAEVQLDYANILRLGSSAQATLANFTKKFIQIQLGKGLANYTVFNESEAEPEIDTPNVSVHPAHQDVVLRIEVRPDGDTIVIVRKGEAQISTPQGIADLKSGDMATVRGTGTDARYKVTTAPERDDWDRWNSDRDRMIHSADAFRHTNKYYVGAEALDDNGRWEDAEDYGQVWVPNEPDGWAPYRDGNWVYEPYYGWTWVGYESWGWAPYHYGRWMWYGGAWAWWPGPVWGSGFYRPFWAPAYVSFFGFGGAWGLGFGWGGWGGFGWLPIGPCDRFFPWWGGYGGRFGVVGYNRFGTLNRYGGFAPLHGGTRFSNVAHINDAHIGGAVSTVRAGKFGMGRVTPMAATHAQLGSAHMMTGNMPVVPTRASLSASGRRAAPSTIHSSAAQHFYGKQNVSHPQSFQQQTARLQQSMQQSHFSPVAAGSRSTGASAVESRTAESHNTPSVAANGKPSAGTPAPGREAENTPSRSSTTEPARSESASSTPGEPNRSEWKTFTPPSRARNVAARSGQGSESAGRGESESYWNRTAPSSVNSRGSASSSYDRGSSSRPQLNMRQPIVQPRSSGGGYGGGSRSAPSSGGHSSGGASHSSSGGGGHSGGGSHK
jgi:FecR protein